jgi:XTP/dITP diphosphohydrolase
LEASSLSRSLVYASSNRDKLAEACRILGRYGLSIQDSASAALECGIGELPTVPELYSSYEGNAVCKAKSYAMCLRRPCLSDDAGIEVEGLGGLPGVYTARFGFERLVRELGVEKGHAARFVCCASYAEPGGRVVSVTASLPGMIMFPRDARKPNSAVPYSFFFIPKHHKKSLAQITAEGGPFLSHRGTALTRLCGAVGFFDAGPFSCLTTLKPIENNGAGSSHRQMVIRGWAVDRL